MTHQNEPTKSLWVRKITRRTFIGGAILLALIAAARKLGLVEYATLLLPKEKRLVPRGLLMDKTYPTANVRKDLEQRAWELLKSNTKRGTAVTNQGSYDYLYVAPAIPKYPHQWFWDSSFHVIITSRFEPEMAKKEMEGLFMAMRPDGFMPNMILWDGLHTLGERLATRLFVSGPTSNLTQPPVIAISLEEVYKNIGDYELVRQYLPLVKKHYQWLETQRDRDGDSLVSVIHPWETGIDSTPSFDALHGISEANPTPMRMYLSLYGLLFRYATMNWDTEEIFARGLFNVKYVMFNCIYAQGLRSIARLSKLVGDHKDSEIYEAKADRVEKAIIEHCWNDKEELFFDISSGVKDTQLKVKTVSSLFPIILDTIPSELLDVIIRKHLLSEKEFWLPYPIPSVSRDEPQFNPADNALLWRGPTWINTNWFLMRGLWKHGYKDIAREIARTSIALADKAGFWEFYNPITSEAGGQANYSWSTLVVDMFDYL